MQQLLILSTHIRDPIKKKHHAAISSFAQKNDLVAPQKGKVFRNCEKLTTKIIFLDEKGSLFQKRKRFAMFLSLIYGECPRKHGPKIIPKNALYGENFSFLAVKSSLSI